MKNIIRQVCKFWKKAHPALGKFLDFVRTTKKRITEQRIKLLRGGGAFLLIASVYMFLRASSGYLPPDAARAARIAAILTLLGSIACTAKSIVPLRNVLRPDSLPGLITGLLLWAGPIAVISLTFMARELVSIYADKYVSQGFPSNSSPQGLDVSYSGYTTPVDEYAAAVYLAVGNPSEANFKQALNCQAKAKSWSTPESQEWLVSVLDGDLFRVLSRHKDAQESYQKAALEAKNNKASQLSVLTRQLSLWRQWLEDVPDNANDEMEKIAGDLYQRIDSAELRSNPVVLFAMNEAIWYFSQREPEKAFYLVTRARRWLQENSYAISLSDTAEVFLTLGAFFVDRREYSDAEACASFSVAIHENVLTEPVAKGYVQALALLAISKMGQGKFYNAKGLFEKALMLPSLRKWQPHYQAQLYREYANVCIVLSDFDAAEDSLRKAIQLLTGASDRESKLYLALLLERQVFVLIGKPVCDQSMLLSARPVIEQVIRTLEGAGEAFASERGQAHQTLAILLIQLAEYATANQINDDASKLSVEAYKAISEYAKDPSNLAISLNLSARVSLNLGNKNSAIETLQKAIDLKSSPVKSESLILLARAYLLNPAKDDLDKAQERLREAELLNNSYQDKYERRWWKNSVTLKSLEAKVHVEQRDYNSALRCARELLAVAQLRKNDELLPMQVAIAYQTAAEVERAQGYPLAAAYDTTRAMAWIMTSRPCLPIERNRIIEDWTRDISWIFRFGLMPVIQSVFLLS